MVGADARKARFGEVQFARWPALADGVVGLLDLEQNVAAAPPWRAVPGHAQTGRASSWARAGLDGHTHRSSCCDPGHNMPGSPSS